MNYLETTKQIIDLVHELLVRSLPGYDLKIGYLTIFSHSEDEYYALCSQLKNLAAESDANNGVKFGLRESINYKSELIKEIRIRRPDLHRPELGCCDLIYSGEVYLAIRSIAMESGWDIIQRKAYEMIELSTPDLAVYAYLVSDY